VPARAVWACHCLEDGGGGNGIAPAPACAGGSGGCTSGMRVVGGTAGGGACGCMAGRPFLVPPNSAKRLAMSWRPLEMATRYLEGERESKRGET